MQIKTRLLYLARNSWFAVGLATAIATNVSAQANKMPDWAGYTTETLTVSGAKIDGTGRIGGIAADTFGYIYVANQDNTVWRISPTGVSEVFAKGFYGSSGIVVLKDGSLLVGECGSDQISHVSRTGKVKPFATEGLSCPVGMTRTQAGDIFAINFLGGDIVKIGPDGSTSVFAKHDKLEGGNGLTSDQAGNLYAVSLRNSSVLKITPEGDVSEIVELPGDVNGHVAYRAGMLFVTKLWEHLVIGVRLDGTYHVVSGDGTQGWADGVGTDAQQSFPNGIWGIGDWLYVNNLRGGMLFGEDGTIQIRRITLPTDRQIILRAFKAGGLAEMKLAYEHLKENRNFTGATAIGRSRSIANRMFQMHQVEAAFALLDWVAEDYAAAQAFVNLGRAHTAHGSKDAAIANFNRALELDPNNADTNRRLEGVKKFRVS